MKKIYFILMSLTAAGCSGNNLQFADRNLDGEDGAPVDTSISSPLLPPITTSPTDPVVTPVSSPVTNPPDNPVCDPLSAGGSGGNTTNQNGLVATLSYLPQNEWSGVNNLSYFWTTDATTGDLTPKYSVGVTLYSSQLNTPETKFSQGFSTANNPNSPLTYPNDPSEVLVEYFSLLFKSEIRLTADQAPGKYQFAIISDDGAILSSNGQVLVNNDGIHPEQMGCSPLHSAVTMDANTVLPIQMEYYQGPRYYLALMLLWRKVSDDELASQTEVDADCGMVGDNTFFNTNVTPTAPTQTYENLVARGWQVVPSENYFLPNAATNPCSVASN